MQLRIDAEGVELMIGLSVQLWKAEKNRLEELPEPTKEETAVIAAYKTLIAYETPA